MGYATAPILNFDIACEKVADTAIISKDDAIETIACARCTQHVQTTTTLTVYDDCKNTETWCADCTEDDSTLCDRCEQRVDADDTASVDDTDMWCSSCRDEHARVCEHCDDWVRRINASLDNDDDWYCDHCRDNGYGTYGSSDDDRNTSSEIHSYDARIFNVLGIKPPDDTRVRYYGLEVELDVSSDPDIRHDAAVRYLGRVPMRGFVKEDGSIGSGHSGLEFVSVPLLYDDVPAYVTDAFSQSLCSEIRANETCGMHVHVSRAPLTCSQLARMARLVYHPGNRDFFIALAGRDLRDNGYARIEHVNYSIRALYYRHLPAGPRRIVGDRYCAINFGNEQTIEFRLFASSVDPNRIIANVETCRALLDFAATCALRDHESPLAFMAYVASNATTFPHLAALLPTLCPSTDALQVAIDDAPATTFAVAS